MVRILSTGEIVQDDDPRLRPNFSQGQRQNRMGQIVHDEDEQQGQGYGGQGFVGQSISVFDSFNQRLHDMGIPRWNLGPYVVEPIVSVGFLVALLLVGFRGLLFAGLLFFVSKYSQQGSRRSPPGGGSGHQRGPGEGDRRGGSSGPRWGSGGGGGHRLGRS